MGSRFVRFECHHCNHCCTEVVCLPTPYDVRRIVQETGANPYAFLEFVTPDEIDDVEENDPTWLDVHGQRYLMALRRDKHGCYFLHRKTGFCTIYEARPLLCRLYPFRVEETPEGKVRGFKLHSDVGCPRHKDGLVEVAPLRAIYKEDNLHQEEYKLLVRAFNNHQYRGKKPEQFIELVLRLEDEERQRLERCARLSDGTWKDR